MIKRAKPIALCEKHGSVPHYTWANGRMGSCVYCVSEKGKNRHHQRHRTSKYSNPPIKSVPAEPLQTKEIRHCEKHGDVLHYYVHGACVYCVSEKKKKYYDRHHQRQWTYRDTKYSNPPIKSVPAAPLQPINQESTRTCKQCFSQFDFNVTYDGKIIEQNKKRGAVRHFCSVKCQGDWHTAHRFDDVKDGKYCSNGEYALNKLGIFRTKTPLDAFDRLSGWIISHLVEKSMGNTYTYNGITYTLSRNGYSCKIHTSEGKKVGFEHRERLCPNEKDLQPWGSMGRPRKINVL